MPAGSVAVVGESPVTRGQFDRWARIAARTGRLKVVPKPPGYTKCIARKKGTKTRRKARCAAEFRRLRDEVMAFLLSWRWIELEAAERSIVATDEEVQAEFVKQRDASFPSDAAYLDFKDDTGQTDADVRYRIRVQMLSDRIRDRVLEESGATSNQEQVLADFVRAYRAKWVARTACARTWRTRDCGS